MANRVTLTTYFESRYKRLVKKFVSLESELDDLIETISETPKTGEPLGSGLYKVRLASKSKGKGKSGGFRVITYLLTEAEEGIDIYLITIYDKSEESSIKKDVLLKIVETLFGE
ncbi:type II toxin-antitoxin system RelE/ParE family toxin [Spirosoma foliorum]|uniref:Type II toxin-antitoxin system RelE/ParE family toxin n=1 Tax=Spirosoma foliorum TaxID=2710596 RepID=A0A7G5GNI9_9BACT|nr:type II toxin-antitoxin system RelE/ParE family toxin [Spirosoma foliorum]QMW00431.1 type II toxin-antitoxin system RelE/ParE family toxin [Spirosoma foliorum]